MGDMMAYDVAQLLKMSQAELDAGVAAAHDAGCELVVATAMPAGGSARNLARLGVTLVQTQAVLTKA